MDLIIIGELNRAFAASILIVYIGISGFAAQAGTRGDQVIQKNAADEAFRSISSQSANSSLIPESEASPDPTELIQNIKGDVSLPQRKPTSTDSEAAPSPPPVIHHGEPKVTIKDLSDNVQHNESSEPPQEKAPETNATEPSPALQTPPLPSPIQASPKVKNESSISPDQALLWLQHGNERYMKKRFRMDGRSSTDRARLLKGAKPHTLILACSDSRVPPELIFDQGLGEVTVVRIAAESLDSTVIASLEQSLSEQGPQLLLVLGHTHCDSIDSALKSGNDEELAQDNPIRQQVREHLKSMLDEKPSPNLQVEGALNADAVARELPKKSVLIQKLVNEKRLRIRPALYRLDTGKVSFY